MFFSAWREKIFLDDVSLNVTSGNESLANWTDTSPIPDGIWATRVAVFAIGGTTIAVLGLLCNGVSIVILSHFRQKSSAPFLLICLEVVDSVLLMSEMFLETLTTLSQAGLLTDAYRDFVRPLYVVMYPVPHIAQTCTTLMTVLITVERYVAVAKPLLASTVCSKTWARRAVLLILAWALLFHVPLYLAYSSEQQSVVIPDPNYSHPDSSDTLTDNATTTTVTTTTTTTTRLVFFRTETGKSEFYNYWFVVWINLICEFLTPFVLIVVFNVLMLRALHASYSLASSPTSTTNAGVGAGGFASAGSRKGNKKRSAREGRLTGMVVAVTVIFFVCELFPALALIIVRGKDTFTECSVACANFVSIADTMVLLNSAVNFVAYCAIGKQFRDLFVKIFLRFRRPSARRWRGGITFGEKDGEDGGMVGMVDKGEGGEGGLKKKKKQKKKKMTMMMKGEMNSPEGNDGDQEDRSELLLLCEDHQDNHHRHLNHQDDLDQDQDQDLNLHCDHRHNHYHHHLRLHRARGPEKSAESLQFSNRL